jgi:methionyl aminopeptidase
MIPIKTKEEIDKIRKSAKILEKAFQTIETKLESGVRTESLDQFVENVICSFGAQPAFKGYRGYPASICVSIDNEVVHGIPGKRKLKTGEIVSIDIGVQLDGYYSDAAKTYGVGKISPEKTKLINTTRKALHRGIRKCRQGNRLSDISYAIQSYAEANGFSVVTALVGHGIGSQLHEEPQIPNYGPPNQGPKLKRGMVFAIEPMINMGSAEVKILKDGWTVETVDRLPSAHFEHTVLITKGKPEILTLGLEDKENWGKKNG